MDIKAKQKKHRSTFTKLLFKGLRSTHDSIRDWDYYGNSVTLNYKG